jgi:hypothetical protein
MQKTMKRKLIHKGLSLLAAGAAMFVARPAPALALESEPVDPRL